VAVALALSGKLEQPADGLKRSASRSTQAFTRRLCSNRRIAKLAEYLAGAQRRVAANSGRKLFAGEVQI
jgi:hypothetical protein